MFGMLGNKDQPAEDSQGTVTSNTGVSVAGTDADTKAEFVCKDRFADHFWSTDERCISVLMHKLKSAKQTSQDILQMVSARATMEEELGKKLSKLSRSALGSEEVGGLKIALRTVRSELEQGAKTHIELAKQLRADIEKPLATFITEQRNKRRAQTNVIQRTEGDRNALRSQLRKLQDKRRADTKRVGDLDLQVNGLQAMADPKLRSKFERAQAQQRATEAEYTDTKVKLKKADGQWVNAWRSACDVFQVLEEERIEYLKTALWTFTNLVSSSCVADDESMERIRQDLEQVSVADDITAFIKEFGTGTKDPAAPKPKEPEEDPISPVSAANTSSAVPAPLPTYSTMSTGASDSVRASTPVSMATRQPTMSMAPQSRPSSMHSTGAVLSNQQQQQLLQATARPVSSMQGPIGTNQSFRRASNNDMYAMAANGNQGQPQQVMVNGQYMVDPRANSSMGMYQQQPVMVRGHGSESPVQMVPMQQQQQQQQQRAHTPNQMMADMYNQPPRMESPRSRANTYTTGNQQQIMPPATHTGNFGTMASQTQMHPSMMQTTSAPGSPYMQPVNNRPMSAAGNNPAIMNVQQQQRPGSVMSTNQGYQQQQMVNRPPTQMSHSPQMYQQRAPSVMGTSFNNSPQMYQPQQPQQQQQQRPGSRMNTSNTTESGKDILFYVKVLYDYDAENDKELTIRADDVISVMAVSADGWWEGELTDRRTGRAVQGTFPSNFTDPISNIN